MNKEDYLKISREKVLKETKEYQFGPRLENYLIEKIPKVSELKKNLDETLDKYYRLKYEFEKTLNEEIKFLKQNTGINEIMSRSRGLSKLVDLKDKNE